LTRSVPASVTTVHPSTSGRTLITAVRTLDLTRPSGMTEFERSSAMSPFEVQRQLRKEPGRKALHLESGSTFSAGGIVPDD
jgi:hypothetical protein